MFKKILLITLLLAGPLSVKNGYYQSTKVEFEGINETCYGTLLSRYTVSGSWSTQLVIDLYAPEEVKKAFAEYEDNYFYLNYFQDVTDGLLYWNIYPPDEFKILLYFPETNKFIESEPLQRYALESTYKVTVNNDQISVSRNYNYFKLIANTLIRIILLSFVAIFVSIMADRPNDEDIRCYVITNTIFQILLNVGISIYSFRYGFSVVEYYMFLWLIYVVFYLIQSYIYSKKIVSVYKPPLSALYGDLAAYALGLFLVDVFPGLYTIF